MCKELEKELKNGENAANALIEHLENMGADNCKIPITNENGCYVVEVRKTLCI